MDNIEIKINGIPQTVTPFKISEGDNNLKVNNVWYSVEPKKESESVKDYEILSFITTDTGYVLEGYPNGTYGSYNTGLDFLLTSSKHAIHCVKRLADGWVFTLKDKTEDGIISRFSLEGYTLKVDFTTNDYLYLRAVNMPKQDLYTTHDGVKIYDKRQNLFLVDNFFNITHALVGFKHSDCNESMYIYSPNFNKYFFNEEQAKEYISFKKPVSVTQEELLKYIDLPKYRAPSISFVDILNEFFKEKINL